jgi:hypothetical protein
MEGRGAPHCLWLHCNQDNDNATIAMTTDAMSAAVAEQSKLPMKKSSIDGKHT